MELVDAKGRRWRVLSITRTGRGEPFLLWLLSALLSTRQSRIVHDLEPLEPISLDEVKDRNCASIQAFPEDYGADEGMEDILEKLLRQVRSAKSINGIYGLIRLDSFISRPSERTKVIDLTWIRISQVTCNCSRAFWFQAW